MQKVSTAIDMQLGIARRQAQDLPEEDATAPDVEMAALLDVAERRPGLRQSVSLCAKRMWGCSTVRQLQQPYASMQPAAALASSNPEKGSRLVVDLYPMVSWTQE
jgi:hypothetical protein